MKRFIYLILVLFFIASCEKDSIKDPGDCDTDGCDTIVSDIDFVLSTDTLFFEGQETKSLFITTDPASRVEYKIIAHPDWITVIPESGYIDHNIVEIEITSHVPDGFLGSLDGMLDIMSTSGSKSVYLDMFVDEQFLYSLPDSLKIPAYANSQELIIFNNGNIPIHYTATASNNYITLSSATDSILAGQQGSIIVSANREDMQTGQYSSMINLTINGEAETIDVLVDNLIEQKLMLDVDVIDAEYSKVNDVMVYVSATPSALNIYDVSSGTIESIPLSFSPTSVSVSPDGATAAVGHDARITYVDLNTVSVIKTMNVSCDVLDIVLTNDGWAYAFPRRDQWERIRCVNLTLPYDNEVLHIGSMIYAGTKARLHPSGNYIYGANNGLSPSDIEKYDIQEGQAVFLYDSPYHGTHPMGGDLWFSDEGTRLITRGKTVLKLSENPSQDLIYNGSISLQSNYARIKWLDHSSNNNELYIISTDGDTWDEIHSPYIYVHNANNLVYKHKFELEKYLVPGNEENNQGGGIYDAEPYFVFGNSNGSSLVVLTKAMGSGLINEWAIQIIEIE